MAQQPRTTNIFHTDFINFLVDLPAQVADVMEVQLSPPPTTPAAVKLGRPSTASQASKMSLDYKQPQVFYDIY